MKVAGHDPVWGLGLLRSMTSLNVQDLEFKNRSKTSSFTIDFEVPGIWCLRAVLVVPVLLGHGNSLGLHTGDGVPVSPFVPSSVPCLV